MRSDAIGRDSDGSREPAYSILSAGIISIYLSSTIEATICRAVGDDLVAAITRITRCHGTSLDCESKMKTANLSRLDVPNHRRKRLTRLHIRSGPTVDPGRLGMARHSLPCIKATSLVQLN